MRKTIVLLLMLVPTAAFAQFAATFKTESGTTNVTSVSGLQPTTAIMADTPITLTCEAGVDCGKVTVDLGDPNSALVLSVGNPRTGMVPVSSISTNGTTLRLVFDGQTRRSFRLFNAAASTTSPSTNSGTTSTSNPPPLVTTPADPCNAYRLTGTYQEAANRAHFVVTPGGSVLQYPSGSIDENDVVVVHVVTTDDDLLKRIEVARTSPTREEELNLIGAGEKFQFQSANPCFEKTFELGDFAPGEGKFEIYTVSSGQKDVLGTTTFKVDRLWAGVISFGPAWNNTADFTFGLTPQGTKNVIFAKENGDSNIIYVLQYTQYSWGQRDESKTYPWREHFNPTIGFAVSDFRDHAFAGLTFDWKQFLITGGLQFARTTRLAKGFTVGAEFTGAEAAIPTETQWESSPYIAVTVDARVARTLLNSIIPGGS